MPRCPAEADTDDTDGDSDGRTAAAATGRHGLETARTPIQTTRTHSALSTLRRARRGRAVLRRVLGAETPPRSPRRGGALRRPALDRGGRGARRPGGGLRHPAFRRRQGGREVLLGDYAEDISWSPTPFSGTARVERVAAEFERGATIVLQALHVHHPPLARFCRDLERELGHPAQTNAYYTPPSAQGFRSTTTRTTSSASRSRARSAGSSIRRSSSCRCAARSTRPSWASPASRFST